MSEAEKDGVTVPTTLEEYCVRASTSRNEENDDCILDDLDDLDPYDIDDYDEDEDDDSQCQSYTDSGNEET